MIGYCIMLEVCQTSCSNWALLPVVWNYSTEFWKNYAWRSFLKLSVWKPLSKQNWPSAYWMIPNQQLVFEISKKKCAKASSLQTLCDLNFRRYNISYIQLWFFHKLVNDSSQIQQCCWLGAPVEASRGSSTAEEEEEDEANQRFPPEKGRKTAESQNHQKPSKIHGLCYQRPKNIKQIRVLFQGQSDLRCQNVEMVSHRCFSNQASVDGSTEWSHVARVGTESEEMDAVHDPKCLKIGWSSVSIAFNLTKLRCWILLFQSFQDFVWQVFLWRPSLISCSLHCTDFAHSARRWLSSFHKGMRETSNLNQYWHLQTQVCGTMSDIHCNNCSPPSTAVSVQVVLEKPFFGGKWLGGNSTTNSPDDLEGKPYLKLPAVWGSDKAGHCGAQLGHSRRERRTGCILAVELTFGWLLVNLYLCSWSYHLKWHWWNLPLNKLPGSFAGFAETAGAKDLWMSSASISSQKFLKEFSPKREAPRLSGCFLFQIWGTKCWLVSTWII